MEYILSYNIIDIPHRQGIENPVTDGLSRMWRNRKRTQNDGSTWSVLPYWEASKRHRKSYRTMSTPRDIFWKPHSKVTYSSLLSWKIYSEKPQVIQLRNDEKQCTGRKVSCLRTINYGALGPKPGVECRRSYTYVTDIFCPDCGQECIECPHCESFGPAKLNALLQPSNLRALCARVFILAGLPYFPGLEMLQTNIYLDMYHFVIRRVVIQLKIGSN